MRALAVSAVALVLGVGAASAGATPPNVRGTLMRGPITPVCIEGRPCDAPAPGVVLAFSRGGVEVKRVTTGAAGRFALRLSPGVYQVRAVRRPIVGSAITPARFRVPRNQVVVLRLHMDTGIR
jgi:hypothetical protein